MQAPGVHSALVVQGTNPAQGVVPSTHIPPPSVVVPHTGVGQPLPGLQLVKVAHVSPAQSGSGPGSTGQESVSQQSSPCLPFAAQSARSRMAQ